jgi:hypothetical protein
MNFYYTIYLHGMTVNSAEHKVFLLYLNSFMGVVLHGKDCTFMLGGHRMCFKILHGFTGKFFFLTTSGLMGTAPDS